MKIGISSSCLYPMYTEESFKLIASRGVELTEIFFNANCELEPQFIKKLNEIKNPNLFYRFDTNNPNFQNMQVGDFIHVSYMYGEDLFSGEQYITAINGPYVFSAWETPRGGNYNNSAPFQCNEIQAAYNAFAG